MDSLMFDALNLFLLACLVVTALAIARLRGLFAVAMLSGIYSLLCASVFVLLDAVDVAFTEAAVGAGMTTVLFLATFGLTRAKEQDAPHERRAPALITALACGAVLLYALTDMPEFGQASTPVHTHPIAERYIVTTHDEVGIPNMVTTLLASYRGFDTLGEVVVVFTAGIAVLMLLGRCSREREETHR
ncbi:MAG: DUF4040 domain-containing protein [Abyssibacter sp.]|uniref:DUF4040 domain-containing protein n=1 Tax=Abyssibacter sp. TaxID=2320200 RepID=UPI002E9BF50D|nr:DUF4040 domain-containing protein [Pseudomonadota bacterium]